MATQQTVSSIPRLAFVRSAWHRDIVDEAERGFVAAVGAGAKVALFEVPGAFELPLHTRLLAQSGRFDAIVAAGFVVDGGIYRHDFVADAVINGLMRVQLDTGVPVFSSVLTPHQFHDDGPHHQFFLDHMHAKGHEAAHACLTTLAARAQVLAAAA